MHDNIASSANANDFQVRQRFATTVELLNYAGGATDTAAVQNYFDNLRNNDPTGAGIDWFITTQAPGGGFVDRERAAADSAPAGLAALTEGARQEARRRTAAPPPRLHVACRKD